MKRKLMFGDCLERMKEIPDNSVDLVLTDPPYGTTVCKWDTVIPFEPMWRELKRIAKANGAICLFGSEPFSSALRMSNIKMFKYDWIWKKGPTNFLNSAHQPLRNTEIISVFYKKKPIYCRQKVEKIRWQTHGNQGKPETVGRFGEKNLKEKRDDYAFPRTIIEHIKKEDTRKIVHPTQKPVALLEYLITTYTLENETVLDFAMGSGSTGVACKNLKRNFIGIEKDKEYFRLAKQRIKDA
jgi:site-specific DNA-methyltransferase (adenine-specific)